MQSLFKGCDLNLDNEAYLAYLPLAHIFELTHEILMLFMGIKIGYSSPLTLTDSGVRISKGQKVRRSKFMEIYLRNIHYSVHF